ncbi:hypothetical protein C8Q74DRAFT_1205889 [Fomes fomentarius]|nr:hypothetical protein C8Q74DRAFT_1205889 [Fomes fomentarius]
MTLPRIAIVHQSSHRLRTRALHGQRRGLPFLATSTSPRPRATELPERCPPPNSELLIPLVTRPIPEAPRPLATSPHAFLDHLRSPSATPFVIRAAKESARRHTTQAKVLLGALRVAGDRLVEVEAGRYDGHGHRQLIQALGDNRFEVPLSVYLDWLTGEDGPSDPSARGMLLYYLAQWRARDDVPGLAGIVRPPALLAPFLHEHGHEQGDVLDLYQSSFFVGPAAAVSPLHRDPYDNLYHLLASSEPAVHGKHFLLLPPSLSDSLTARDDIHLSRNTSRLDFRIRSNPCVGATAASGLEVLVNRASAPTQTFKAVMHSSCALSCVLEEGDMLFLPRGWWHRVENVELQGGGPPTGYEYHSGRPRGWTAGVGWWFLSRSS